ncbi:putative membrane protein, partial [Escherichia coli 178900]
IFRITFYESKLNTFQLIFIGLYYGMQCFCIFHFWWCK